MKNLFTKPEKAATDAAWAQIDAERKLQQIKILLGEALTHIEDAETLDRDALNGWVSSALLVAMGKQAAQRQVKKGKP